MKQSYYNFLVQMNNSMYLLYNSRSNALIVLNDHELSDINDCLNGKKEWNNFWKTDLIKGCFILEDELDEMDILQCQMFRARYATNSLGLTLAPTSDCNCRCIYCYEKDKYMPIKMSEATQKSIINFVETYADHINNLHISWYGGEPLLAIDVIERLSMRFMAISEERGIHYSAGIVTNGYLLSEQYADILKKCMVLHCQVTLDGLENNHDKRRPLANGGPTFERIVKNLEKSAKYFRDVSVRVNIDRDNQNEITELNNFIKEKMNKNVTVYPAPIKNKDSCHDCDACISNRDFLSFQYEYYTGIRFEDVCMQYPTLRDNVCCADSIQGYVINADGEIYKCWSDIGSQNLSIGNINDLSYIKIENEIRYIKYNPFDDAVCRKCKMLPICMGGCAYDRVNGEDRCFYDEEILRKYILKIGTYLMKKREEEKKIC